MWIQTYFTQSSGSSSLGKYSSTLFLREASVAFPRFMRGETDRRFAEEETHQVTLANKGITWIHSGIKEVGYHLHDK